MPRFALALAFVLLPLAARADRDRPAPRRDAPPAVGQVIEETFAWCGKEGSCQCFQPLDCVGSACSTVPVMLTVGSVTKFAMTDVLRTPPP